MSHNRFHEKMNFSNCNKQKYKIINNIFYPNYNAGKCNCQNKRFRMYDYNMVWIPEFAPIAQYLLLKDIISINGSSEPYIQQNIPDSTSSMSGIPLYDELTGSTFIVFKSDGNLPVENKINEASLIINMKFTSVDYKFSYIAVPTNPAEPVKVSFYTASNIYGFSESMYWLMLDNTSHFTTYTDMCHTFTIPSVPSWIAIVENVAALYVNIATIPVVIAPLTEGPILTDICIDCEEYAIKIADSILEEESQSYIIRYNKSLIYSVNRMRDYVLNNSKSLLLPLIPSSPVIAINASDAPQADPVIYTGISTYGEGDNSFNSFYSDIYWTNNINLLEKKTDDATPVPSNDKTDSIPDPRIPSESPPTQGTPVRFAGSSVTASVGSQSFPPIWFGIDTTRFVNEYIKVSWSITYTPRPIPNVISTPKSSAIIHINYQTPHAYHYIYNQVTGDSVTPASEKYPPVSVETIFEGFMVLPRDHQDVILRVHNSEGYPFTVAFNSITIDRIQL